jgi:hypothetical protein
MTSQLTKLRHLAGRSYTIASDNAWNGTGDNPWDYLADSAEGPAGSHN